MANQYRKSDKLVIFAVSEEFLKSNFWLSPKKYSEEFDICCVNYSLYYCLNKQVKINYFFALDFSFVNHAYMKCGRDKDMLFIRSSYGSSIEKKYDFLRAGNMYNFNDILNEIRDFFIQKNTDENILCLKNSGIFSLFLFIKMNIYKEIHLIGMNLIPNSGAINSKKKLYEYKTHRIRKERFPLASKFVEDVMKKYDYNSVYKTCDKSNLSFLNHSNTFYTCKDYQIDKNIIKSYFFKNVRFKKI